MNLQRTRNGNFGNETEQWADGMKMVNGDTRKSYRKSRQVSSESAAVWAIESSSKQGVQTSKVPCLSPYLPTMSGKLFGILMFGHPRRLSADQWSLLKELGNGHTFKDEPHPARMNRLSPMCQALFVSP